MKALFLFVLFFVLISFNSYSNVKTINPKLETTPIIMGTKSSDDTAIWIHPKDKAKSLILGTNKNKPKDGGHGGLAVYNLNGEELKYFEIGALNNVDIIYDIRPCEVCSTVDVAIATNRDKMALSFFKIDKNGKIKHWKDLKVTYEGAEIEPYGFCSAKTFETKKTYAYIPQKNGHTYQYEIKFSGGNPSIKLVRDINLANKVTPQQDEKLRERIMMELIYEGEEDEFEEELNDRFQLEGCVADEEYGVLYIGMENVGIFKTNIYSSFDYDARLIAEVGRSYTEMGTNPFPLEMPRITDDIEGLSIYHHDNGKGYLLASIQGISEFAIFDRYDQKYYGSFKIKGNDLIDDVTETDGIEIVSTPLNSEFPFGMMVVHDDKNLNQSGELLNANYKIISFKDIIDLFPELIQTPSTFDPRK